MKKTLLLLAAIVVGGLEAWGQLYYMRMGDELTLVDGSMIFYEEDATLPTIKEYLANPPAGCSLAAKAIRDRYPSLSYYDTAGYYAYILAMPNDQVYSKALGEVERYYRYATTYEDNYRRDMIRKRTESGYDAMREYETWQPANLLAMHLVYQIPTFSAFPFTYCPSTFYLAFEEMKKYERDLFSALYLDSYHYYYPYNDVRLYDVYEMFNYKPTPLFAGVAYQVDSLAVDFGEHAHDYRIECGLNDVYQSRIEGSHQSRVGYGPTPSDSLQSIHGEVSGSYLSFNAAGTAPVQVTLKLPQLPSGCKFDIYAVTVPEMYNCGNSYTAAFTATLNYIGDSGSMEKISELKQTDGQNVETHLLFENFEFPYSYIGLPDSYPTITFTTERGESGKKKTKTNNLCIDYILIKCRNAD